MINESNSDFMVSSLILHGNSSINKGRHYKRLTPIIGIHQKKVDSFLNQYWWYYKKLFNFKNNPNENDKKQLSAEFDELFSTKTNYDELDDRISKSKAKKKELLTVLDYPEMPLHNNASEIGARVEKRWEDVSFVANIDVIVFCSSIGVNSL